MLLHHETIVPAVSNGIGTLWFWIPVTIGAVAHWLKHLWIWLRYGSRIDTEMHAPDTCEGCKVVGPLWLVDTKNDAGLLDQRWLCSACKEGVEAILTEVAHESR